MADVLCFFLMARDRPVTVPPVPAPAMMASTLPDDGRSTVPGVDTTASMISGPVVSSCASGLFGYNVNEVRYVSGENLSELQQYARSRIGRE